MVPFAGYEMPVRYGSQLDEHHAVRKAAGLFDVSHMGEVDVEGPEAVAFLQRLSPNDVSKLRVGQAHYNALLSEQARFIDDLLVYRLGEQHFLLVINAGHRAEDLAWIEEQARPFDVHIDDRSDATALIALQGPASAAILSTLTPADLPSLRYYRFALGEVSGIPAMISRTGYTGEDGFELYVDADAAPELWESLLDAGEPMGLVPAGLGARDTLRLEAGMLLSGQDIGPFITPYEAGLGWIVKLDKGTSCIGSEVLQHQREHGIERRLVGFELEGRAMARTGYKISVDGIEGTVTSGSWSPTLERSVGIACIESSSVLEPVAAGSPVVAQVRRSGVLGKAADLPFYRRSREPDSR